MHKQSLLRYILFLVFNDILVFFFAVAVCLNVARADDASDLGDNLDLIESNLSLSLSNLSLTIAGFSENADTSNGIRSHHSEINIVQNGSNNVALIRQSSNYSQAIIEQLGMGNLAGIEQVGSDNYASIKQFGAGNFASVAQVGVGNTAIIVQHGRQQFSVQQIGHNDTINIVQY
jgi:minor curlin subunit